MTDDDGERTAGQHIMDQLRAIYRSRRFTQAQMEQKSGGALRQSSVSRLLKGIPEDPGIDTGIAFARALDVDLAALIGDAIGSRRDDLARLAELQAIRHDLGRMYDRVNAALHGDGP